MKTFLTLILPALIVLTGVSGILFFENGNYNLSAVSTLASYLGASLWIYILNNRKAAIS